LAVGQYFSGKRLVDREIEWKVMNLVCEREASLTVRVQIGGMAGYLLPMIVSFLDEAVHRLLREPGTLGDKFEEVGIPTELLFDPPCYIIFPLD
jgi:hypothetical protein